MFWDKLFGEFYTPDWLAELTLRRAGFPPPKSKTLRTPSLLDPACGSGTFLFTAVRLLREAGRKGKALTDFCGQHLAGIDVHPLAVSIAKTNLLLALGDDVRRERGPIVLPVCNAYQPELLASRKSCFVVGNPPWLSYRYIKRRDYQERVRRLGFAYGLLDRRGSHLVTQMDLATLFFVFCAKRFLAENGTLAFVMPRSILTGARQHAVFRDRFVAAADCVLDCEQVAPLFNVPACVVIAKKEDLEEPTNRSRPARPVAMLRLQGQLPARNASLVDAERHWQVSESTYTPAATGAGSPDWSEVTQGASLAPRCFWFVRTLESAQAIDPRRPWLETDPAIERQAKAPWKGVRLKGKVEAEFLFATLLSDNMLPFGWRQWSMVALPLVADEHAPSRLIGVDEAVRMGAMGIRQWLKTAEEVWWDRRKSEWRLLDWLNWQNKLAAQRPAGLVKLLYNKSGTHLCACVVDVTAARGFQVHRLKLRRFVADYRTYWIETHDAGEAHYLCSVLNSPLVDEAIKPHQTKGTFSSQRGKGERDIHRRPFEVVPIPRFNRKDGGHRELARLSARCHEKVQGFLTDAEEYWLTAPIGRLRRETRADLLKSELDAIDEIVAGFVKTQ